MSNAKPFLGRASGRPGECFGNRAAPFWPLGPVAATRTWSLSRKLENLMGEHNLLGWGASAQIPIHGRFRFGFHSQGLARAHLPIKALRKKKNPSLEFQSRGK